MNKPKNDVEEIFKYWRQVEGYFLSVIERDYCTYAGMFRGRESAILSGPVANRKLEWLRDGNFAAEFNQLETGDDVRSFIKGKLKED